MQSKNLLPVLGMNNVSDTQTQQGNYVRLANHINITPKGELQLRAGVQQVSPKTISCLWQSPLHGDVFGLYMGDWVLVDVASWQTVPLVHIGDEPIYHALVNNQVMVSGRAGIFIYDGRRAIPLTIDNPLPPVLRADKITPAIHGDIKGLDADSHKARTVVMALSYLTADGKESGLSPYASIDGDVITVTLPTLHPNHAKAINIYATRQGGSELCLIATIDKDSSSYTFDNGVIYGTPAPFTHLSPIKTGKYLCLWRGRLVSAHANILSFSQPLAYHLTDERHDYIALPQRISFVIATEGGIWVGQTTGVVFLMGDSPDTLTLQHKTSQAPITDSAVLLDSQVAGELSGGGQGVALWLASNGYVLGTAEGQLIERHAGVIDGIGMGVGSSVVVGQRVVTAIS